MAYLTLNQHKLKHNFEALRRLFNSHDISWGVVSKLLCGNPTYLEELLALGAREILDSRVSNLKMVKQLCPEAQTVYIKPPAMRAIPDIIRYVDVSFNTELETIQALSQEACRQDKIHKIIIMIEMGDLREGVMRDDVVDFYAQVFELPNIQVIGLGTNLNCLSGVMPNEDKLIQLGLYKRIIELTYDVSIPWVSAGTTVTIPLLQQGGVPKNVNHFRIGEALFFGQDLVANTTLEGFYDDIIMLNAEVIEVAEKPMTPSGELGMTPQGKQLSIEQSGQIETAHRVILDVGYLDINPDYLVALDEDISILHASSDMIVLDVGSNATGIKVGDVVPFRLKYMGALHLMNSPYIDKLLTDEQQPKPPQSSSTTAAVAMRA